MESVRAFRLGFLALLASSALSAQTIQGTVTERTSGARVPGAGIVLRDGSGHVRGATLADSSGFYRITAPSAGVYSVSIQGRGLIALESPKITLAATGEEQFDGALALGAAVLPSVTVEDRAIVHAPPGNPHKYDEFLKRKQLGFGRFITRAEIDSKPNSETRTLFEQIPGIKVRIDGTKWYLQSQRCAGRTIPGLDASALTGGFSGEDPKSKPMIFINGSQTRHDTGIEIIREIAPQQIEAIEVYQGASEMPTEAKGDACFAIFIWTR